MLEWAPILEKGVTAAVPTLVKAALDAASERFKRLGPYKKIDFSAHLQTSFNRCTKIKTIVNGDSPVDLLHSYVPLNFTHDKAFVDGYELIEQIRRKRNVVISGAAGSGKSMFMRYLWISCFVDSRGKIPLFIELRALNSLSKDDLLTFVFHTVVQPSLSEPPPEKNQLTLRQIFDAAFEEGQFFFILDGFDELSAEKRAIYEPQILRLTTGNDNIVVVSGRPDDRFDSWQLFYTFKVAPLSKKQVIELINCIDFDSAIKKKFVDRIKKDLYDKHKDFVSRPLLATMMLLTFGSFADVPEKMHVFYDQAFDTLFARHDATKEAFRRRRNTDFSIDDFKRLFGVVCLLSYREQTVDFSETALLEHIKASFRINSEKIGSEQAHLFLKDLLESVCVLQKEGVTIVFSHRSFQEYFCAYALLRLPREYASSLMIEFSSRYRDNVLNMLCDMNRSFFEDNYVDIMIDKSIDACKHVVKEFSAIKYLEHFECSMIIETMPQDHLYVSILRGNDAYHFIFWMSVLYRQSIPENDAAVFLDHVRRPISLGKVHRDSLRLSVMCEAQNGKLTIVDYISEADTEKELRQLIDNATNLEDVFDLSVWTQSARARVDAFLRFSTNYKRMRRSKVSVFDKFILGA